MPSHFSNEEYADIIYVYGFCDGNARAAVREYERRFPNRRVPNHQTFTSVFQHVRDHGSFPNVSTRSDRPMQLNVNEQENILQMVERSPQLSTRRICSRTGIPRMSVWRTLHNALLYPFHNQKVQHLEPGDFALRLNFCQWLQEYPQLVPFILFSDESQFTRDGVNNTRNSHLWSDENPHGTTETNFQRRFSVNVWCGMIDDQLIGPFFFEERLTGELYANFLRNELLLLLDEVPLLTRQQMFLQHDGAPAHFSRHAREYLNVAYPNRWIGRGGPYAWPPRSPDLTPLDYYLWGYLKSLVYEVKVNTRAELIQRIQDACEQTRNNHQVLRAATQSILDRSRLCINAEGGHFEQLK